MQTIPPLPVIDMTGSKRGSTALTETLVALPLEHRIHFRYLCESERCGKVHNFAGTVKRHDAFMGQPGVWCDDVADMDVDKDGIHGQTDMPMFVAYDGEVSWLNRRNLARMEAMGVEVSDEFIRYGDTGPTEA